MGQLLGHFCFRLNSDGFLAETMRALFRFPFSLLFSFTVSSPPARVFSIVVLGEGCCFSAGRVGIFFFWKFFRFELHLLRIGFFSVLP